MEETFARKSTESALKLQFASTMCAAEISTTQQSTLEQEDVEANTDVEADAVSADTVPDAELEDADQTL